MNYKAFYRKAPAKPGLLNTAYPIQTGLNSKVLNWYPQQYYDFLHMTKNISRLSSNIIHKCFLL